MTYCASKLFKHLIEIVILLSAELNEPDEPLPKMPSPPEMKDLGTTSDLDLSFKNVSADEHNEFKDECNKEIDRREARGDGDKLTEMQEKTMPAIGAKYWLQN